MMKSILIIISILLLLFIAGIFIETACLLGLLDMGLDILPEVVGGII